MKDKNVVQPKDTGKLTNFHYGSKKDHRSEKVHMEDGEKKVK